MGEVPMVYSTHNFQEARSYGVIVYLRLMIPFHILRFFKSAGVGLGPEEKNSRTKFSHSTVIGNYPCFRGLFR